MQVMEYFATPICYNVLDNSLCEKAKEKVLTQVELNDMLGGVFTTPDNLHLNKEMSSFVSAVDQNVKAYAEDTVGISHKDLSLSGMWANIHNSYSYHPLHNHPNSYISGVVYLETEENNESGKLIFEDPRSAKNMFHPDFKKETSLSNRNIWITPQKNYIILFPSWLKHSVEQYISKTKNKRISLSFNYNLVNCTQESMKI